MNGLDIAKHVDLFVANSYVCIRIQNHDFQNQAKEKSCSTHRN